MSNILRIILSLLAVLSIAALFVLFVRNPINNSSGPISTATSSEDRQHSIPLNEIISGGVGKDGIPSIDDPQFINSAKADTFLEEDDIGLGLTYNGVTRFYPYDILVWHEIVNDTAGGESILVTYCPLCGTGIVFERRIDDEIVEFGVSGKLYKSNLLMYDRREDPKQESYWSQILGEAVVGPQTGTELNVIPANTVRYGEWKTSHPNTQVLSRDTGANRRYGSNPYGGYDQSRRVSFGADFDDDRLHPKAMILGVKIDDTYKAYPKDALPVGTTTDAVAGTNVTIVKNEDDTFEFTKSGEEIAPINSFWFAWLAVHPDTLLYNANSNN